MAGLGKTARMQVRQIALSRDDERWKWVLLVLCGLAFIALIGKAVDVFGLGERPWFGYWDSTNANDAQPYTVAVTKPRPDGALARAGVRDGDRIDLRRTDLATRTWLIWQPPTTSSIALPIQRNGRAISATVAASTVWEDAPLWKIPPFAFAFLAQIAFLSCALLILTRRSQSREGRVLALVMILTTGVGLSPANFVIPNATIELILSVLARAYWLAASCLMIYLSSLFGTRYAWRVPLELLAYALCFARLAEQVVLSVGLGTLAFDPLPFARGPLLIVLADGASLTVALVAVAAVTSTERQQRSRAAWLLLPLPIVLEATIFVGASARLVQSWFSFVLLNSFSSLLLLLGALLVTYALLKRRVLDVGFVVNRSIVVAIVSLIVVGAFVLLEWALGLTLAGVTGTTGLIANAGLALALGVSLRFIHKRVDDFVDTTLFRKRYDDDRALRDFSKEAAFITQREALLDQALAKLRTHTNARAAAIFVGENGGYHAVRTFGEAAQTFDENDPAALAMKAWHKPLDLHRYATALRGDLALPMVSRGQLLGVLVCGERDSGEAYTPNEIEALASFAHGVGTAYDGLRGALGRNDNDELLSAMRELRESNVALRESIEKRLVGTQPN
jgi:hypothetical protein